MRCLEVTKKISDSYERNLTLKERIGVQSHLLICPHCRNFNKNCATLSQLMKDFAQDKK